jgi:hypothetical protein
MLRPMDKKHGVWVLWIGSLAMMLLGSGWVASVGHIAFWFTLVAHIVECFMNLELFRRAGGSMANHIVMTLIYGLFHWSPIKERLEAEGS